MLHRCRNCNQVIEGGSDAVLSGCPECGNKSWWAYIDHESTNKFSSKSMSYNRDDSQNDGREEFVYANAVNADGTSELVQSPEQSASKVENPQAVQTYLNQELDGIRIVEKGKFEINLTQMYRDEDYVIKVDEAGHYTIEEFHR